MLKAFFQKIASWFKSEAAAVEQKAETIVSEIKTDLTTDAGKTLADLVEPATNLVTSIIGAAMNPNINTAIQIALALKAIDDTLSADAVQAATNAALAAAYPAPAADAAAQPAA